MMLIRDANAGDTNAVAEVYLSSVVAAYSKIATQDYVSTRNLADCTNQWSYNIRDNSVTVVVAEDDGVVKGVASFGRARDEDADEDADERVTAELQAIYVSPDHWSQGIGGQLCNHVMHRLSTDGFKSVLLWVLSANTRAIRFYEEFGFVPDGKNKIVTMGQKLTATRYGRPVP